jgi:hypothetical protein
MASASTIARSAPASNRSPTKLRRQSWGGGGDQDLAPASLQDLGHTASQQVVVDSQGMSFGPGGPHPLHIRRFSGIHDFVPPEQIYTADHVQALRDLFARAAVSAKA